MREIKFRAISKRTGQFVFGDLLTKDVHHGFAINESGCVIHPVKPETIGQYTGLKDLNGNEIYEGDIAIKNETPMVVSFKDQCFVFTYKYELDGRQFESSYFLYDQCRIVGNIHQNPELL